MPWSGCWKRHRPVRYTSTTANAVSRASPIKTLLPHILRMLASPIDFADDLLSFVLPDQDEGISSKDLVQAWWADPTLDANRIRYSLALWVSVSWAMTRADTRNTILRRRSPTL